MKIKIFKIRFFLIILIILISVNNGFSDTIDYYHVYYNKTIIHEFNSHNLTNPPTIEIEIIKIQKNDELIVKYNTDTPCKKCKFCIYIKSDNQNLQLFSSENIGQFKPLSIDLAKLLEYYKKKNEKKFRIYYFKDKSFNEELLFYIELI